MTVTPQNMTLLDRHRRELEDRHFTVFPEVLLVPEAEFRTRLHQLCFSTLQADLPTVHLNRERTRDVLEYVHHLDGSFELAEAQSITLVDRNYAGAREYLRVSLLHDPGIRQLVAGLLSLIPESAQKPEGTFGINCFRTHTVVTQTVHQDLEEYVAIYCVAKNGRGATTVLCHDPEGKDIVAATTLEPGQILMFADRSFYHYATPLEAIDNSPYRDALVMTVNK